MTREVAIETLNEIKSLLTLLFTMFDEKEKRERRKEALEMAIQALSQEPSRGWEEMTVPCENCGHDMTFKIAVCGEQEPCDDAISRADLGLTDFEIVMCNGDYKQALEMLIEKIQKAPPVTPSRRKGHWIREVDFGNVPYYVCSECGVESVADTDFCFACGADMRGAE